MSSMSSAFSGSQLDLVKLYRQALAYGFTIDEVDHQLKRYLMRLKVVAQKEAQREKLKPKEVKKRLPLGVRILAVFVPLLFISIGLYLLGNVVVPIFGYYVNQSVDQLRQPQLVAPIPESDVLTTTPQVISFNAGDSDSAPSVETEVLDSTELDYTNLANWFVGGAMPDFSAADSAIKEYRLDIPKLKITNAKVTVGGTDLSKSLVAFPGTALPGQAGSPVIFGHSVLRRFYNPSEKNPRRYMSIFSTIMTLKSGDKIYVTSDGVKYTYVVQTKKEVKPEDVYILTQKPDAKTLKLVTCVPEGTTLRRGVVEAVLVE